MKAHLIETWGVKLGYAAWIMGGWFIIRSSGISNETPRFEWWPHYASVRAVLECDWNRAYGWQPS